MNYGGYALAHTLSNGWFYQLVLAMKSVAEKQGLNFILIKLFEYINTQNGEVKSLTINGENIEFDAVIASSDYHHNLNHFWIASSRNYDEQY